MRAEPWHDVNHGGFLRLQPKGKFQALSSRRNQNGSCLAAVWKLRIFDREKYGLKGFKRSWIPLAFNLEIGPPIFAPKRPGVLQLRIGIHLAFAEAYVAIDGICQIVIHHSEGTICVRTDVS